MLRFSPLLLALITAPSARAQQSGLLLGLSSDSGYRTLWIAPVEARITVAARLPNLVVPHDDGFHLVSVMRWCSTTTGNEFTERTLFVNESDEIVDRSVGSGATVKADSGEMACTTADSLVTAYNDSVAQTDSIALANARTRADSDAVQPQHSQGNVCGYSYAHITYVTARYTSLYSESGATEYCSPALYTSSGHRVVLRESGTAAELLPLLTTTQSKRVATAWKRQKGDCALEASPGDSWGIVRGSGEWDVVFATSGATACRGQSGNEEAGFDIALRAPAAMARRDPAASWLPLARKAMPRLDDILVSPTNDLVAVRTANQLSVFLPRDRSLGAVRLEVELRVGETIVMAEWATGHHVDEWTVQLTGLHAR